MMKCGGPYNFAGKGSFNDVIGFPFPVQPHWLTNTQAKIQRYSDLGYIDNVSNLQNAPVNIKGGLADTQQVP